MSSPSSDPTPESPDSEWPEAWLMTDSVEDQKVLNKLESNVPVNVSELRELGIAYVFVPREERALGSLRGS